MPFLVVLKTLGFSWLTCSISSLTSVYFIYENLEYLINIYQQNEMEVGNFQIKEVKELKFIIRFQF